MFIPKGTMIIAPATCLHLDDTIYKDATAFDPFRFARMREADGEGPMHQIVSTSLDYLPYGHGRNAWYELPYFSWTFFDGELLVSPSRFLAAHQMETMAAHIVMTYDMKLENTTIPESTDLASSSNVKVVFRKKN